MTAKLSCPACPLRFWTWESLSSHLSLLHPATPLVEVAASNDDDS